MFEDYLFGMFYLNKLLNTDSNHQPNWKVTCLTSSPMDHVYDGFLWIAAAWLLNSSHIVDGRENCGCPQKLSVCVSVCARACAQVNSLCRPFRNCWSSCHVQCECGSMNPVSVCMFALVKMCVKEEALEWEWIYWDSLTDWYILCARRRENWRTTSIWVWFNRVLISYCSMLSVTCQSSKV